MGTTKSVSFSPFHLVFLWGLVEEAGNTVVVVHCGIVPFTILSNFLVWCCFFPWRKTLLIIVLCFLQVLPERHLLLCQLPSGLSSLWFTWSSLDGRGSFFCYQQNLCMTCFQNGLISAVELSLESQVIIFPFLSFLLFTSSFFLSTLWWREFKANRVLLLCRKHFSGPLCSSSDNCIPCHCTLNCIWGGSASWVCHFLKLS